MQQDQRGKEQNEAIDREVSALRESCLCGCILSKFRHKPLEKLSCICGDSPLCFSDFDLAIEVSKATPPKKEITLLSVNASLSRN